MIGEDFLTRQQATGFGLTSRGQRGMGAHQQFVDFGHQTLGAECAPVSVTHVLQNVLRNFAPTLFSHQDLVGFLLGAVISDAEIQQAPTQTQTIHFTIAFFRGRWTQADLAVFDADRGTAGIVVTAGVTGRGDQAREHLVTGYVAQVRGQRAFHQFEAVVEVVFQCAGGGFVKGDRCSNRLLAGIHA
ncbi:hypothetical protein D3C87_1567800 [compost metagenome]